MVESQPSKLLVAGSIPVSRSSLRSGSHGHTTGRLVGRSAEGAKADVAQLAERVLGKDEVTSSILVIGSSLHRTEACGFGQAGLSRRSIEDAMADVKQEKQRT